MALLASWKLWLFLGIASAAIAAVFVWRNDIRRAAYDAVFADIVQQQANIVTDSMRDQMESIHRTVEEMDRNRDSADADRRSVRDRTSSSADGPVSQVTRDTLRELQQIQRREGL